MEIKYNYTATEYNSRKYTCRKAVIEKGTINLPEFKSKEECKAYIKEMIQRGCSLPYTSKFIEIEFNNGNFSVHTCNSIVVDYKKECK